jgi:hypothetical protein
MDNECMKQGMHIGPSKDMGGNHKPSMTPQPIKRTVSHVTERKAPKGRK